MVYNIHSFLYRVGQRSSFTKDALRKPANALHTYRCLQFLELSWNNLVGDYFLFIVNNVGVALVVISNWCLVRFSATEPLYGIFIFIVASSFSTAYLIMIHIVLGNYNEVSKSFVSSWMKNTNLLYYDRKAVLKYIRSCRLLRVQKGSFGYFKKTTSLDIVGKIIFYTAKALMLAKIK